MLRRTKPHTQGPEIQIEDWVTLDPPELPEPLDSPPPAIAFFLQKANRSELAVAYKALLGLLVGGEAGLDRQEVEVAREMYLALQRELARQLHSAIFPHGGESPLPF